MTHGNARSAPRPHRLAAAAAALALLCAACPKGDGDGARPGAGGGDTAGDPLSMTLTVKSPDGGRKQGSARLEATQPVTAIQLTFAVPDDCRITAGAMVRTIAQVAPGAPVTQEIQFECPAGSTGVLRGTLSGKDSKGAPVEKSVEASF